MDAYSFHDITFFYYHSMIQRMMEHMLDWAEGPPADPMCEQGLNPRSSPDIHD